MKLDRFNQQIEELRSRVAALLHRIESQPLSQETHTAAFEEIETALEELQVAQEELCQLNQQLATAHEAVEAQAQRYQDLFESAPDGYIITDLEGTIQEANRAAATLLNVSKQFLVGQSIVSFVAEEERQFFQSQLTQPRVGDWVREWGVRLQPCSRKLVDTELTVAAVRNKVGKLVGFRWLLRDITHRKHTESALRQSEQRLSLLVESAKDYAIFTLDSSGYITSWNPGAERILGYQEAEIIGQHGSCIFTPEDRERQEDKKEIHTAAAVGRAEDERWHVRKDGTRFWASGILTSLRDESGLQGFAKIMRDFTERKQAESEREQLLEREQMARAAAEAANRMKDEFLAVVSHELRTPLNPILGWSKLLISGKFDAAKTTEALATIERNAKLQAQLIEDLLDVSRILQGKLSLNVYPVNLESTIAAAIETVQLAAGAKNIQLEFVVEGQAGEQDKENYELLGDPNRLQQVVWNLLSNAVKFTSFGGRVEIRLERVEMGRGIGRQGRQAGQAGQGRLGGQAGQGRLGGQGGQAGQGGLGGDLSLVASAYAQITVTDTGKGISPDFLPYIFDYFRQESSATTRKFGGLGLGLAIVRNLVELHGGTVVAESPGIGQGATFRVILPLMQTHRVVQADELQETEGEFPSPLATHHSLLEGIRVLVVDDELDSRELNAFILEQDGAIVTTAGSAPEALQALAQSKPDVLISDIGMPNVDGYMLMRQIRALPELGQIPAIALTAYAGEYDRQQALTAGFQMHLSKPVEPGELVEIVARLAVQGK